jgi:hypothetical protein
LPKNVALINARACPTGDVAIFRMFSWTLVDALQLNCRQPAFSPISDELPQ